MAISNQYISRMCISRLLSFMHYNKFQGINFGSKDKIHKTVNYVIYFIQRIHTCGDYVHTLSTNLSTVDSLQIGITISDYLIHYCILLWMGNYPLKRWHLYIFSIKLLHEQIQGMSATIRLTFSQSSLNYHSNSISTTTS